MDQCSLYEAQASSDSIKSAADGCDLKGRNDYIVNYVNKSIFKSRESIGNIAELSIGDGSLTVALLQSNEIINLTCADISPKRISLARSALLPDLSKRTRFLQCNFDTEFQLLSDNAFDVVIALDIMEHVFDVFNFINHCRRILRQEGTLILRVPNIAYIKHRLSLLAGQLPVTASWFGKKRDLEEWKRKWGWDGGHLHLFTLPMLYKLLDAYNFKVLLCRDPGTKLARIRNIYPSLLYSNPVIFSKKI